jgi:hypothetical protein
MNTLISTPAGNFMNAKYIDERQLSILIPTAANLGHYLRAFQFCEYIGHFFTEC